jgi:hypothetical protein
MQETMNVVVVKMKVNKIYSCIDATGYWTLKTEDQIQENDQVLVLATFEEVKECIAYGVVFTGKIQLQDGAYQWHEKSKIDGDGFLELEYGYKKV